jgi:predicted ester cyclase
LSNAALIRAATCQLFEAGDVQAVSEFFDPDYTVHLTGQDLAGGHKLIQGAVGLIRQAFPDLRVEVEVLMEGNDRIAWQRTLRGTQQGAYKGFPASGRIVGWCEMVVSRFSDGQIVEEWVTTDLAEQLLLSRKR